MSTSVLIDSSVYVSSIIKTDVYHKQSILFFRVLHQHDLQIITPRLIVFEVINTLTKLVPAVLNFRIDQIFGTQKIIDLDENFQEQVLSYLNQVQLKTADFIIASCAATNRSILVSWDKILLKESRKITRAVTPSEFMSFLANARSI